MGKKHILVVTVSLFVAMIDLVLLQSIVHVLPETTLNGMIPAEERPALTLNSWLGGQLQSAFESWFNGRLGFRGYFVKTDNEINYLLFNEIHQNTAVKIVVGNNGYLFEKNYIDSSIGKDHRPLRELEQTVADVKQLSHLLAARGIPLVLLIAPTKTSFYPEQIPAALIASTSEPNPPTNYDQMLPLLSASDVDYVDIRDYFLRQRSSSPHPLFARGGSHWTLYGSCLVVRQVLTHVNSRLRAARGLPDCDDVDLLAMPRSEDRDLADLTNLWSARRFHQELAYPRFGVPVNNHIDLLMVGDSFGRRFLKSAFDSGSISDYDFYYYFNTDINSRNIAVPVSKDRDFLRHEILRRDLVIIEAHEAGLGGVGFGFIPAALTALMD
jgi:alginate O-acetyltransferase complex protein AlgJ